MDKLWRGLREVGELLLRMPLSLKGPAVVVAALAGLGVARLSGSIPLAVAVGLAALFAGLAAIVIGTLAASFLSDRERTWGLVALAIAAGWLAHPALLLLPPPAIATALAPVSIAASLFLFTFAAAALEAGARP